MIAAYDLDGVLASGPPESNKPWRYMNGVERAERKRLVLEAYLNAHQLLDPPERQFHVVTARKDEPAIRKATEDWLFKHFGSRILSISMLKESRSIENVVKFKGSVLTALGATKFTEDNMKVLRGIQKDHQRAELILFYFDGSKLNQLKTR